MTAATTTGTPVATRSWTRPARERLPAWTVVAVETAFAALAMAWTLGRRSLWFDEAATADVMRRSLGSTLRFAVTREPTIGAYYVLLRPWTARFGTSEAALRSFSLLAAVACVPVVYALAARLFGTPTGLVAGLLTAVSTTVVAQGQQARQYALALLLVSLAGWCFVRAVQRGTTGDWLLYAVVAVLAVYGHQVSLAVVVAQGLSLLFLRRDQVSRRGLLLAAGVVAVGLLPLGALLLRYGAGSTTWIPPTSFDEFVETLESLAGGTRWLLAVTGVACAVALVAAVRTWTSSGRGPGSWRYGLLVCWLVVPFVLVTLVSLRRHVFLVRYFVGVLPAVVILAAVGIVAMKPRWFAALFLAGLVALNVAVLADWLSSDVRTANTGVAREDWRGAVHHVVRSAGTDDAVVFQFGHLELVWSYYARGHDTPRLVSDPTWDRFDESRVASIPPGHPHVWVLVSHVDPARQRLVRDLFARRYDLGATREFDGDIDVLRYDARD